MYALKDLGVSLFAYRFTDVFFVLPIGAEGKRVMDFYPFNAFLAEPMTLHKVCI